ncbi:Flp pilus assembly protein CpaB [Shimia biformata]|uniref:Flp pilus assembly protein CpaB n=1 Tax=Shimia biformata TaxID=1294299 RepID=UPI00194F7727|nr:Flp pilus assembly protein CpaB [Shimia biformata]
MRSIFAVVLMVGLGLAGFAVYMAQNYIQGYQAALEQERAQRAPAIETVDAFVMNRAIKYGEDLKPEDVRMVKWPKNTMPEGLFTKKEALFSGKEGEHRVVLRAMEKNEPILAIKVTKPGEDAGITSRLERGMRAFAIKVDVASGVSGFLRPGDRVDVYWTGKVRGSSGELGTDEVTKLIEAGVSLIAIDQTASDEVEHGSIARTVTVSVKPQQVAALAQAQTTGRLSLSLVGAEDDTIAEAIEVDQKSLLGITDEEIEVAQEGPQKRECTIRTRRAGTVVEIPIPCTN